MSNRWHPYERPGIPRSVEGDPVLGTQFASTSRSDSRVSYPSATTSSSRPGPPPVPAQHPIQGSAWSSHHHPATEGWDSYDHRSAYAQPDPQMMAVPAPCDRQLPQRGRMPQPYGNGIPQMVPPSVAPAPSSNSPGPRTRQPMTSTYNPPVRAAPTSFPYNQSSPAAMQTMSYGTLPPQNFHFLSPNCPPPHLSTPCVEAQQRSLAVPTLFSYPALSGAVPNSPWERESACRAASMPPSSRQPSYLETDARYDPQDARSGLGWAYYSQPPSRGSSPPPSCPLSPTHDLSALQRAATTRAWHSHTPPQQSSLPPSFTQSPARVMPILCPSYSRSAPRPLSRSEPPAGASTVSYQTTVNSSLYAATLEPVSSLSYHPPPSGTPSTSSSYGQGAYSRASLPATPRIAHSGTVHVLLSEGQSLPPAIFSHTTAVQSPPSRVLDPILWNVNIPPQPTLKPPPDGGTGYFSGAHDFSIPKFEVNNHQYATPPKTVFEFLRPYIVHGAAHDSNERCDAPACHEETRVAIRQNIMGWITHGDGGPEPKRIMWLSGPAGGGKTAIAGSVAVVCKEQGLLAGTFMFSSFSGSPGRMSKRSLIITLAYHMSQHKALRSFATQLLRALEEHPDIFHKQLNEQAECLILAPFRSIDQGDRGGWPSAIIIDGLDEVVAEQREDPTGRQRPRTSEEDQVEILDVLLTLSQSPSVPFRIFISSRPESNITQFFASSAAQGSTLKLFLDSKYNPDTDIRLFLMSKFSEIRRHRGLSDAWPGEDSLSRLVEMSSGQFIVPTTVIRWVESGIPQRRLDEVLKLQKEIVGTRNPFASLDILYHHILLRTRDLDDDPRLVVKWILIINPSGRYSNMGSYCAVVWRYFLEDLEGEFDYRMEPMTSLVSIPPPHDTQSHVAFYHKSLADFLSTKSRCGDDLYVDDADMIPFIARRLLRTFKKKQVDVPFPLPDSRFRDLSYLVRNSNYRLSEYEEQKGIMKGFLLYEALTPGSKAALSACDVIWWIDLILNNFPGDTLAVGVFGGLHCTIHKAMECNRHTPSSPEQDATNQTQDSQCHETRVRWRRDILARAKERGWCVHRLEEIEVGELENVKWGQMKGLVGNVRSTSTWQKGTSSRGCGVCHIPALEDVRRRVR